MKKEISQRLKEYEKHYDMFFEQGRPLNLPYKNDGIPGYGAVDRNNKQLDDQCDPLKTFIEETIEDNPQVYNSDGTWGELLKERTMQFVDMMLHQFMPIEEHEDKEQAYINKFKEAAKKEKEQMLPSVTNALHRYYTPMGVSCPRKS